MIVYEGSKSFRAVLLTLNVSVDYSQALPRVLALSGRPRTPSTTVRWRSQRPPALDESRRRQRSSSQHPWGGSRRRAAGSRPPPATPPSSRPRGQSGNATRSPPRARHGLAAPEDVRDDALGCPRPDTTHGASAPPAVSMWRAISRVRSHAAGAAPAVCGVQARGDRDGGARETRFELPAAAHARCSICFEHARRPDRDGSSRVVLDRHLAAHHGIMSAVRHAARVGSARVSERVEWRARKEGEGGTYPATS